jgi:hypothetical protein
MSMRGFAFVALFNLGAMLAAGPTSACIDIAPIDLHDVSYADVVVVGRVTKYTLVLDSEARKRHQEFLAHSSGKVRELLGKANSFMTDYARLQIAVEEVLRGTAPHTVTVTWDNTAFSETMPPTSYLIALRSSGSPLPPLRGATATILPDPDPASLSVLRAPCSAAFFFESTSTDADIVRQILNSGSK